MTALRARDSSSTGPTRSLTAIGSGLFTPAAVAVIVAILTAIIHSWARSTVEDHPIAWGPMVLKVHLHNSPEIGPLTSLPEHWALGLIIISAAAWFLLTLRWTSLRTAPGGLVLGGLASLALDTADDRELLELIQVPGIGVLSPATAAVIIGLLGLTALRWANADPHHRPTAAGPTVM